MDEAFWELLRAWMESVQLASLERQYKLPSPTPPPTQSKPRGNAVFIDGMGRVREMNIIEPLHVFRFPIPSRPSMTFLGESERFERIRYAEFRLTEIKDGRAIYHYESTR